MEKIVEWLLHYYHTGASLTEKLVVSLVSIAVVVAGLAKIFEAIIKCVQFVLDGYAALAARRLGGRSRIEWLKRKCQFLNVLASDLASIAKAEAWNDQHFTDLEAEVEVEGRYYSSALNRLIRKKSSGLRREASLISAIDGSSERCLLLVGDPGSGKSVALRHLALQLIQRSSRSKKEVAVVPLYVNLREMPLHTRDEITADSIKSFVVDNIRRDDADTADYVRQNWEDFRARGIWFFLFDSFDEIPDVMHAAAADQMVSRYGEALRKFMDGLGSCRGVLASREYKCPTTLHWPKLRILPLSERLQEELVRRTFLSSEEKATVLRYVSLSPSATFRNPLFLTLLARYVKKNGSAPVNEHELLYDQLNTLAHRDADYVADRWGLNGALLLDGASELARLFALAPQLSLAPTLVEIQAAAVSFGSRLEQKEILSLVEALTYVKIGRTDVASADRSVRRFAFSHRRYQECLFALFLLENRGVIPVDELILDSRWREYLVALLQISPAEHLKGIAERAAAIFGGRVDAIPSLKRRFFGLEVRSYNWDDPAVEHILGVFLEAKLYSPNGPWGALAAPVEKLLGGAWSKGDFFDQLKVIRYCGIGCTRSLTHRVEVAVSSGIQQFEEEALGSCRFLTTHSRKLANWVRGKVSLGLVCSTRKFQILRWEAIAAGLPETFQIDIVVARAKSLNRLRPVYRVHALVGSFLDRVIFFKNSRHEVGSFFQGIAGFGFFVINIMYASIVSFVIAVSILIHAHSWLSIIAAVFMGLLAISLFCVFVRATCLSVPVALDPFIVWNTWARFYKRMRDKFFMFGLSFIIILTPGSVFYWICRLTGWRDGSISTSILWGTIGFYAGLVPVIALVSWMHRGRLRRRVNSLMLLGGGMRGAISKAQTFSEVLEICRTQASSVSLPEARNIVAMFTALERALIRGKAFSGPRWLRDIYPSRIPKAASYFLEPLDARH